MVKFEVETSYVLSIFGSGLVFDEGQRWKGKRKILNEIFNFDFIRNLTPKIAQICEGTIERLDKDGDGQGVSYDIHEYSLGMASTVVLSCFLGAELQDEQIEGKNIGKFLQDLASDVFLQSFSLFFAVFGVRGVKLGLRKVDKDINRRVKLYQAVGRSIVDKKIQEVTAKHEKHQLQEKPADLIEAVIRNSL